MSSKSNGLLHSFRSTDNYPKLRPSALPAKIEREAKGGAVSAVNNWKEAWRRHHSESITRRSRQLSSVGSSTNRKRRLRRALQTKPGVLNDQLILAKCSARKPSDICSVKLSDCKLQVIDRESLRDFRNLVHVDCGANEFEDIDGFSLLENVELLELPLNRIARLSIPAGAFQCVTLLDLSYNRLSTESLWGLGQLPLLSSLDLTGNDLTELETLAGPGWFPSLRDLILDSNKIGDTSPFSALCGLPQLKFLSLNDNRIQFVPLIEVNNEGTEESTAEGPPAVPFPSLEVLSLVSNKIQSAADILNAGEFHSLLSLYLWKNPIASKTASLPRIVQVELCDNRGIEVLRKEPLSLKPKLELDTKNMVKAPSLRLPVVKLGGALQALEEAVKPPPKFLEYVSSLRPTTADNNSQSQSLPPIDRNDVSTNSEGQSTFLTQLEDDEAYAAGSNAWHSETSVSSQFDQASSFHQNKRSVGHERSATTGTILFAPGDSMQSKIGQTNDMFIQEPRNPFLPPTQNRQRKPDVSPKHEYFSDQHAKTELSRLGFPILQDEVTVSENPEPSTALSRLKLDDFAELFRDDDDEDNLQPTRTDKTLPKSIAGSIKALRHALDHPLRLARIPGANSSSLALEYGQWNATSISEIISKPV